MWFQGSHCLVRRGGGCTCNKSNTALASFHAKLWKKKLAGERHGGTSEDVTSTVRLSTAMTPLERPRRSYEEGRGTKAPETDPIDDAVAEWLNQDFFPDKELRKHRHRMGKDCSDIDWARVNRQETLYISSFFYLCEWWLHAVSTERHTLVYLILPAIIALPPSNTFLERIFSARTLLDDPLR